MNNMKKVKDLMVSLIEETEKEGIPFAGMIVLNNELISFDSHVYSSVDQMKNVQDLVGANGEITEFLISLAHANAFDEEDSLTLTNPQLKTTQH